MSSLTAAQALQQNNRDGAGQYATKAVGESGVDLGAATNAQLLRQAFSEAGFDDTDVSDVDSNTVDYVDDGTTYRVNMEGDFLSVNVAASGAERIRFSPSASFTSSDLSREISEARAEHVDITAFADVAGDLYDPATRSAHSNGVEISGFELCRHNSGRPELMVTRIEDGLPERYHAATDYRGEFLMFRDGADHSILRDKADAILADVNAKSGIDVRDLLERATERAEVLMYGELES